ncbi:hypothetical protein CHN50_03230 [Priestia aryabhattai]|uniref:hypothetical protein n=1 Tax=Bacillaceae TaxID=186817 RepID=UPI000BA05FFE|nr:MULTISPECIES: hypothetical protein [Bacillaceae]MDT2046788.1 hypothetical protein [Priestia flexa]OZT14589.1 hypothetical protein CHN50_03230 [Priestia aryabhattai]TDB49517.1 hypothetical protein EPL02_10360 [Bacillus sp. CBEL-1]
MEETMKPNYKELGHADILGPKLKDLVEKQLLEDLKFYGIDGGEFKFDWSESCIEGHDEEYLDGIVENFSGVNLFNKQDEHQIEGWMEFIYEPEHHFFIVYWEFLHEVSAAKRYLKDMPGIPEHVFIRIPEAVRPSYKNERLNQ